MAPAAGCSAPGLPVANQFLVVLVDGVDAFRSAEDLDSLEDLPVKTARRRPRCRTILPSWV